KGNGPLAQGAVRILVAKRAACARVPRSPSRPCRRAWCSGRAVIRPGALSLTASGPSLAQVEGMDPHCETPMTVSAPSDALVFFGATGDLAYKQIFPALQALIRRGLLRVPIIGVAKSGWTVEQLRARAHDSLEHHGGVDRAAFDRLTSLLRYVDGDYSRDETF